ncbi:MAG: division/cell wall cluster transcriptional repressor MraZ [Pseudomonadota bacterium]|nr:division/cell wall cluster transcriptional repressor MraZ [Pseudomonadota bacterium]
MFRGISNASLDAKGRMALPARNRDTVAAVSDGNMIVTIDVRERCLLLYPLPEWEVVQRKLESLSNINPEARLLQRLLIGHATDLELDGSGRLLLPGLLRTYAELKKKLVLVGQGNKIEIWSQDKWQESMQGWLDQGASSLLNNGDSFTGLSV